MMLNEVFEARSLPYSMNEAIIIVIPKPSKNALFLASYSPIPLLILDVKLLVQVLANRLATVAQKSV